MCAVNSNWGTRVENTYSSLQTAEVELPRFLVLVSAGLHSHLMSCGTAEKYPCSSLQQVAPFACCLLQQQYIAAVMSGQLCCSWHSVYNRSSL